MSKVAQYLQEHLMGEVTVSPEARRHFAYDASILRLAPAMIVYPRGEDDIRKTARFAWQLAERGRTLPITARGGGSDTSGAALSSGILMVTPAHMHRILALDPKKEFVTVEPGVSYDKLQQTLYTHGLFLPAYPSSAGYATIGGGLANNAVGERSVKYGDTLRYVQSLRVVLSNGEVIETAPLNRRDLNRKMGLSTLEGQIYRSLDALIEENYETIANYQAGKRSLHNTSGYNLSAVKTKDGFNLTPLFVGSQGTLGIISEATLKVTSHNPATTLTMISLEKSSDLATLLPEILRLKPSLVDMINRTALEQVAKSSPSQLANVLDAPKAEIHLFVEFDDGKEGAQKKCTRNLVRLAERYGAYCRSADNPEDQQAMWKVRQSVATILAHPFGGARAVPVAEDVSVPVENLSEFLSTVENIYAKADLPAAIWGQAGSGIVRMHPILDLAQLGDRQKLFKVSHEIYSAALALGGAMSAGAGDGRVRSPYLMSALGEPMHKLMLEVKKIFDPHGILNPGVKTATEEQVKAMMRSEYNLAHRHEHLPRS
ncbi:MAG TPA: FAD-binding oxidoreductase [Candidatus Saccharimonadales bacterium]|nr:FAD-binding oxidoreductase [Candidatus Saccharimonadales bacterium]